MTKFLGAIALGCGFLASVFGSEAQASFTITSMVGGSALPGQSYSSFDSIPLGTAGGTSGGVTVSFAGTGQAVMGSSPNAYAAPILSGANNTFFGPTYTGADTTTYLTTGTGSVTLSFAGPETYLGLLWGSVDSFNKLTFFNGSQLVGSISGSDALPGANGGTTTYVNISSSLAFTSVVASSSSNAFEFDNVAYSAVVPEPSSIALCGIAGLGGLAFSRARRKRTA